MQATSANQGYTLEYSVIGRLNKDHCSHALNPQQIKNYIANALTIDVDPNHIIHVAPNYIIQLDDGHAQAHVLATHPLIHTNYFLLEILPWSKEHERCQLPWISAYASNSDITIDPLTILPVIATPRKQTGLMKLMDTFAARIPRDYDLRAPDYSYLAITEMKTLYYMKFSVFRNFKNSFTSIQDANHKLFPALHNQISSVCAYIHSLQSPSGIESMPHVHGFATDLKNADITMDKAIAHMDRVTGRVCTGNDDLIDLEGFKDGPTSAKVGDGPSSARVGVPHKYAERLKTIFIAAIERILNSTPIIETIQKKDKTFETYITVNNFTRKYYGDDENTAAEMEAAAIYYWLKQICNVQGYRIIDLNYPTLAKIVTTIDRWNEQINALDFLTEFIVHETRSIRKEIVRAYQGAKLQEVRTNHDEHINIETGKLVDMLDQHLSNISHISHEARSHKNQYNLAKMGGYSPSRSYYRLGRAMRPPQPQPAS